MALQPSCTEAEADTHTSKGWVRDAGGGGG
jgi:hypothetical protein